jgi:hypothetical protein
MTKRKTKKKKSDALVPSFRHPLSLSDHPIPVRWTVALLGLLCAAGAAFAFEPARAPQSSGGSHAHGFVIFATVFNDRGFALYGARTRLRREEEKKFRWEAMSDHEGELAFRVPPGEEYEMVIEARGFETQTRKVDTRQGNRVDLTIRMEPPRAAPAAGGKP